MSGIVMYVRCASIKKRMSGALSGSEIKKSIEIEMHRQDRQTTATENEITKWKKKNGKKISTAAMFGFVSSFFCINGFFDPTWTRDKKEKTQHTASP